MDVCPEFHDVTFFEISTKLCWTECIDDNLCECKYLVELSVPVKTLKSIVVPYNVRLRFQFYFTLHKQPKASISLECLTILLVILIASGRRMVKIHYALDDTEAIWLNNNIDDFHNSSLSVTLDHSLAQKSEKSSEGRGDADLVPEVVWSLVVALCCCMSWLIHWQSTLRTISANVYSNCWCQNKPVLVRSTVLLMTITNRNHLPSLRTQIYRRLCTYQRR